MSGTPIATGPKKLIPLTEDAKNLRKIPKAVFIENTEAWVDKYGSEDIIA